MTNEYPRLCGGTFFTLLLQARKQRSKAREHRKGERDGLSDMDVLVKLIKVMNPDYVEPTATTKGTFKSNTSDFKSCKISGGIYLPLGNTTAFDNRIIQDYQTPLRTMCEFVDQVIDAETSLEKDVQLVKALLELIELDASIDSEQEFYLCENGAAISKAVLRSATEICLPSFLLGIWHFILTTRKDNAVGKPTYEAWCPPNGGAERKYIGKMGESITRSISITTSLSESRPSSGYGNEEDEPSVEFFEPIVEEPNPYTSSNTTQIVSTPAVFINHGANGIQINNNGTLNIDRGGEK